MHDPKKQAKKLLTFVENPQLAILDELQESVARLDALIDILTGKEAVKITVNKEVEIEKNILDALISIRDKEQLEIPKTDLSRVEKLLENVLNKLAEIKQNEDTIIDVQIT